MILVPNVLLPPALPGPRGMARGAGNFLWSLLNNII